MSLGSNTRNTPLRVCNAGAASMNLRSSENINAKLINLIGQFVFKLIKMFLVFDGNAEITC